MEKLRAKLFPYATDTAFMLLFCILVFVPIAFSNFTYEKFETIKLPLFSILIGCAVLATRKLRYQKTFTVSLGLFLFFGLLATVFAHDKIYSFMGKDYLWQGFYFFILWGILILLLVSHMDKQKLIYLMKVLVVVGVVNSVWSILEMYGFGWYWDFSELERIFLRSPGFIGNPNYTGMFLMIITIFCIYLLTSAQIFRSKSFYAISLFLIIWGIMVVSSRGAIISLFGTILVAGLFAVYANKWDYLKNLSAVFALGVILLFLFTPIIRNAESLGRADNLDVVNNNIVLRYITWASAWKIFIHHPVVGIGWGNNPEVHNVVLNFLVIGGLPILFTFLFIFSPALVLAWKIYRRKTNSEEITLDITLVAAILGFFASALVNPVSLANWVLVGFLVAALAIRANNYFKEYDLKFRPVAAVFIIFGFAFFVSQWLMLEGLRTVVTPNNNRAYKLLSASNKIFPWVGQLQANLLLEEIALGKDPSVIISGMDKMKKLHPYDENSYIRAGMLYHDLYLQTNDKQYYEQSLNNLRTAIRLSPFSYGSGPAAGYAYAEKDYTESKKFVLIALMAHDTNEPVPDVWVYLANIYLTYGNQKAAVTAITEAYKEVLGAPDTDPNPARFFFKHLLDAARKGEKLQMVPVPGQTSKEILI